ncbi:sorting nexin-18 [Ornithorhynchus anatinus]|uniref:sorting nexin-18 n=1 Tax=Ornithorhynchus anatinus TaxID=9258 RepID=UPI0010A7C23E|nr:sorting nexin-18 [Ornithorhynchus anatinus]
MSTLRALALYDFRSENPGEISLREHEVLSLCSERDIDGWLEGVNSHGQRGLFPASYVQVLRPAAAAAGEAPGTAAQAPGVPGVPGGPARYANAGFPHPGGVRYDPPPPQQRLSQGSEDDEDYWDDDWDDGPAAGDEAGAPAAPVPAAGGGRRPAAGARGSATVGRNLNRFSTFVKSGGEAFVLGEASGFVRDGDKLCVVLGPHGPQWQENPYPFRCTVDDPTKQTKFKGMKSYIAYKLVPTHTRVAVHRRYKHFDWLYARLAEKFPVISVPHLPEKQATGRFEEDFISKRRKGLVWWMDHMVSHPVLARCDAFAHFLTCGADEKAWKQGKRKAERDEMVGANFFLTLSTPPAAALDLQEVEGRVDGFKAFTKKMDDSALQLNHTANEFARKQVTGFRKEYQKVGQSFRGLGQAFEMDQQAFSAGLNRAIASTGDAYDAIGELFADQPRRDLDPVMDLLALYQGHLANFPDIIHVQKGALPK